MEKLAQEITRIVQNLFMLDVAVDFSVPDPSFGDLATNIAMKLAGKLGKNPRTIAEQICSEAEKLPIVEQATIAGPGFINIRLTDGELLAQLSSVPEKYWENKVVVCEYSDPNPFKVLHAGHLYTTLVGDSIANLFETSGAIVKRVNFGGDVGLHVAKAMWGILRAIGEADHKKFLEKIERVSRPNWISRCYVEGNTAYEEDDAAKKEIVELNKKVYELHTNNERSSSFAEIYWTCRQWSYDGFEDLYDNLGVKKFDKYYPESVTSPKGLEAAKQALDQGVLVESDGAVVFKGESHGLHTRVFINSAGLPTYETKDLGLALTKWQDYHFDRSVIITANDIVEYMKVVQMVVGSIAPEIKERSQHITHGVVKLAGGQKMSSRKGNVLLAQDVIEAASSANIEATGKNDNAVVLGAIKYAFLKNRVGGDVIYDPKESVSIVGNSGPYLQYAHARACSILAKQDKKAVDLSAVKLTEGERLLVKKLGEYVTAVNKSTQEVMPHYICTYLYELAQTFNRFYEGNRVIGDVRQDIRLALVTQYQVTLSKGLAILGIDAPQKM